MSRLIWLPNPFEVDPGVWKMGLVEPKDATQAAMMLDSRNGGQDWFTTGGTELTPLSVPMTGDGPTTPPAPAPSPPPAPAPSPAPAPEPAP